LRADKFTVSKQYLSLEKPFGLASVI